MAATSRRATTKKVLFVCLGNICRSPAAEGVLEVLVGERGLGGGVEVDSAGTGAYHSGERADPRMRRAASRRGVELHSRARQVTSDDFARFDLVVAMDRDNLRVLRALDPGDGGELRLFSEFLPEGRPTDVPDPYYGGERGFDEVLDLLEHGCPHLLDAVLAH